MTMIIEMKDISKTYHPHKDVPVKALSGLNLSVREGEMLAIYGVSGSGKSTLLHIIGGLDRASSGEYTFDGIDMNNQKDTQLAHLRNEHIGFVLQDFGLISHRTAIDNVMVPVMFSKRSITEGMRRGKELLNELGIGELKNRKVYQMSGGQKQRVAIARALMNQPKLILADEPSGALDSTTKAEIYSIFEKLKQEGKTIIVVTHDHDIETIADRVLQIKDGCLVQ